LFLAITILQNNGLPVIFIQSFQRFFGCQGSAKVESSHNNSAILNRSDKLMMKKN